MHNSIRSNNLIEVGIIGSSGHAKRIIKILEKNRLISIKYIYTSKTIKVINKRFTNNLKKLYSTKALFILAPTHLHKYYLKKFNNYNGHIFCEKPILSPNDSYNFIKNKKNIFVNYNQRYSDLRKILLKLIQKKNFGNLVKISVDIRHGLAWKKQYKNSWRSKKTQHQLGVLETLGVHYLDLIIGIFGFPIKTKCIGSVFSKNGNALDTCFLNMYYKNFVSEFFFSYATSKNFEIKLIFTNADIVYDNKKISIFYPRDNFDKNKNFLKPKLYKNIKLSESKNYLESLKSSVENFIKFVKNRKDISINQRLHELEFHKFLNKIFKNLKY